MMICGEGRGEKRILGASHDRNGEQREPKAEFIFRV